VVVDARESRIVEKGSSCDLAAKISGVGKSALPPISLPHPIASENASANLGALEYQFQQLLGQAQMDGLAAHLLNALGHQAHVLRQAAEQAAAEPIRRFYYPALVEMAGMPDEQPLPPDEIPPF
jgi:hypothetical protein